MNYLFWVSFITLGYIYAGYPVLVSLLARFFGKPIRQEEITPEVSLLIPAHNEQDYIEEKLRNSLALDYPKEKLEIVVASDGSTDRTCEIAGQFAGQGVKLVRMSRHVGKTMLLNQTVPMLKGEIVVFSDASGVLQPDALRKITRNFADPSVGCVCGLYGLKGASDLRSEGEGLYWRYETFIKQQESRLHSILGAHGAFYGIRRELFHPLEGGSINDDYLIAMRIVQQGLRAIYEKEAAAWERDLATVEGEFARRQRIAAGNCQQVRTLFPLLNPFRGWVAFSFFSHKVLRTTSPLWMVLMLLATAGLAAPWSTVFFLLQGLLYGAALLGYLAQRSGKRVKWLSPPFYFCLGNLATLAGLIHYFASRQRPAWQRAR